MQSNHRKFAINYFLKCARAQLVAAILLGTTACHQTPSPPTKTVELPRCAAPRPEASRAYIVFFDQHSAVISHRGTQVTEEFGRLLAHFDTVVVGLVSGKDTSEVLLEDKGLDSRRGQAVKHLLEKVGIPTDTMIDVIARGTTHPLVPTPPRTNEPQNRNVQFLVTSARQARPFSRQRECKDWLLAHHCGEGSSNAEAAICKKVEKVANEFQP